MAGAASLAEMAADKRVQTSIHETEALLKAIPEHSQGQRRLTTLPGIVPGRYDRPLGCLLSPRCPYAEPRCHNQRPSLDTHARGAARCFYPLNLTADVA